jgi:transposase
VVEDFEIEHSVLGWKKFRERIKPYGSIPFAIETSQGAAVEQLLEAGMQVYPLNPKSAQAYRQRKAPSGVKDDRLDAWSFADALRVDGHGWKPLRPEHPLMKELRLLCRDEVGLIEQRTAFINQLRHALAECYPTALEAFEGWGAISAWMFLQRFPTPQLLEKAGKRQWEKFLHSRRLWRTGTPASIGNPTCSWEPNFGPWNKSCPPYTGTGNSEQNRYLQLINSPDATSASGLKAVGVRQT